MSEKTVEIVYYISPEDEKKVLEGADLPLLGISKYLTDRKTAEIVIKLKKRS